MKAKFTPWICQRYVIYVREWMKFTSWRTLRSLSSILLTSPTSSLVQIKFTISFRNRSPSSYYCVFGCFFSYVNVSPNSLIWAFIQDDAFITGRRGWSRETCSLSRLNINQTLAHQWKLVSDHKVWRFWFWWPWPWSRCPWPRWLQPRRSSNTSLPSFSSGWVFSSLQLSRLQQKPIRCEQNSTKLICFRFWYLCFLCLRQCPFNSLSDWCCINTVSSWPFSADF